MINGNNSYWQNSAMNIRKDEDEWRIAKDTVPAPSELGSKEITENGNYTAKDDGLDGYSDVSVSVANSYTAEDEGKVVDNGALVAQTAMTDEVTENGTINTTLYNSVTVNVSGGGSTGNDVIFYDYDGTVVASYSAADFATLTAMPANPTHEGLTAQGWNWTLADAKTYVASYGELNIGQMYITSDGKTRLYYVIPKDSLTLELYLTLDTNTELDIDWGDNSEHTTWTSNDGDYSKSHEYSDGGRYTVAITVVSGGFSHQSSGNEDYTLKKVEFGSGITSIRGNAFASCYSLSSIIIPSSVESIGGSAFSNCSALISITIPSSVTSIEGYTFSYSNALTSITIPSSVTSIGERAFSSCYALTSVTIPNGVTSIESEAFNYCYALTSVTIPSSVESIGSNAFQECYALTSITISNGVTTIGDSAFEKCYALTSITIPSSVESIGGSVFSDCYALTSATIPNGVTSIEGYTFYYCYALTSVTIPSNVTTIGDNAFSNCYALTSITISNGVESIGYTAFEYCGALSSITIPSSVTSIGYGAFQYCYALSSVTFEPTTPPELDGDIYIPSTCIIRVPQGTLSDYTSAENYPDPSEYIYEEY